MSEMTFKTTAEVYLLTVDFSSIPGAGDVAVSNANGTTAVVAYDSAGLDVSSTLIVAGSMVFSGKQLQVRIKSGTANKTYKFLFTAADDLDNVWDEVVNVRITPRV